MQPRSLGVRPGRDERVFHVTKSGYLSSGNAGGTGLFEVSAQNKASKLWKQCSGVQTFSSASPAWPSGFGGTRDIASAPERCRGGRVRPWETRRGQEQVSENCIFALHDHSAASTPSRSVNPIENTATWGWHASAAAKRGQYDIIENEICKATGNERELRCANAYSVDVCIIPIMRTRSGNTRRTTNIRYGILLIISAEGGFRT